MSPASHRRTFAAFLVDFVGYGIAMSAVSMATYLPLFLKTNGATDVVVGLVPAAFAAGRMTGLLAAPLLEARPLVRHWMVGAMLVERLPMVLCGLWILAGPAARPGLMVAGVLGLWTLYTMANGWSSTAWGAYVARALGKPQRALLHGLGNALSALSGLAVVPVVGLAIGHFGLVRGYGTAFLAAGVLLICSSLAFLWAGEEPYPHVKGRVGLSGFFRQMLPVLRADGRFRWFLTAMALWLVGSTGTAYFTVYAIARFHAGAGAVTGFTVAMTLGAGAAGVAGARVAGRVGFVRVFAAGIGLTAASMAAAFLASAPAWLYAAFALAGAGGTASWMAVINLPMELADRRSVPTYCAVASLVRGPVGALSPVAAGLYLGHFPHPPLYLFCAAVSLLAAALLFRHVHEPQPAPEAA